MTPIKINQSKIVLVYLLDVQRGMLLKGNNVRKKEVINIYWDTYRDDPK